MRVLQAFAKAPSAIQRNMYSENLVAVCVAQFYKAQDMALCPGSPLCRGEPGNIKGYPRHMLVLYFTQEHAECSCMTFP